MPAVWRSILLTPNVLGKDGVSALSREMARALPAPALILSLHDESRTAQQSPVGIDLQGARGSRARFLAAAAQTARQVSAETTIACAHLHLAPIAKLMSLTTAGIAGTGRSARPAIVLCGIEAWVPLRRLERWALSTSDVAAISQHTIDRFRSANPQCRSIDIAVCHPGLPATPAPAFASSAIALIVARMSASERYKGHDALLDIWPRLLERHPEAVLTIAGDGDDRPRLEARARELGVANAVHFPGRVSDEALGALYDQCRFFVMPSRDEGFGLVFLEAMRAGKACIGGAGAAAEIIEDGLTGFVVDPASRDDLAAAVLRLYDEPETCARLGAAGRERFLSTFTSGHFQTRFARVIAHDAPPEKKPLAASTS